ncbi:MAG: shikimate kinase [Candidatus Omnitrophota bacterium]|nr:MAG: shikimate kinase [Candidatus Omnitrophota bacterium]
MKNIYLVGFMGTGKTAVGKLLSKKLSKEFIEMDDLIEKKEGRKIVDIFAAWGESHFRKLEKQTLEEISHKTDLIVSCGGGLICSDDNSKILLESGTVFCLTATAQTIYNRTKRHKHRPLLNVSDPLQEIKSLLNKRKPYYDKAHYSIDTEKTSPQEAADKIIETLNKN